MFLVEDYEEQHTIVCASPFSITNQPFCNL